ncbi:hypothetical protein D3C71_1405230 [compost metagenome]
MKRHRLTCLNRGLQLRADRSPLDLNHRFLTGIGYAEDDTADDLAFFQIQRLCFSGLSIAQ